MDSKENFASTTTMTSSTAKEKSSSEDDPFFSYKMTKQICLVIVWVCIGLAGEMSGATLVDLKDKIGVDYEQISRALVGKSIGLLIGSVVGGFLQEILYKQTDLLNGLSLFVMSFACIVTPFSVSVPMAAAAFFINGFAEGIINTGGNTMVMHLWGDKAAAPMHSLHFGFGLGAFIAPQIARSFLSPEIEINNDTMTTMPQEEIAELSRIEIPYAIAGLLILLFGFVIIGFYIKGPPEGFPTRQNATKLSKMVTPGSCAAGNTMYGLALFIGLFFYFIQAVGGERAYGKFIFSYAYETKLMDKDQASVLTSLFWLSFTTGRLLGIPLTKWFPLYIVIIGDICLAIFSSIMLAIFADTNVNMLWTLTVTMGLSIAVVFPNGMSWANLKLEMNSVGVMVLMVGGSCGGFIYQLTTGSLFENAGPQSLMYIMVAYSVGLLACYVAMETLAKVLNPKQTSYGLEESEDSELCVYSNTGKFVKY